jgi:endonuclease/exonuclease/phosphatase family metal-dependent hydrolase
MNALIIFRLTCHLLSTLLLSSTGCQTLSPEPATENPQEPKIVLDGSFSDWKGVSDQSSSIHADGQYIYLRFSPSTNPPQTIQAAPFTTRIRIDADNNARTGRPMRTLSLTADIQPPQGVDLLIELSPKNEKGSIGIGSAVTSYSSKSQSTKLNHDDLGFMFLPTYASPHFEARIDRTTVGSELLKAQTQINLVVDQIDQDGKLLWSSTVSTTLPPLEPTKSTFTSLPTPPDKSVRVMSSNVLFSSPLKEPEPFQRILNAAEPDVILYQEWFNTPKDQVQSWLNDHSDSQWSVHMPDAQAGVAIASRLPILETYESVIPPSGEGRPARAVAALIQTKAGELLAISVHLKCCGSAGSREDIKRIEQAKSINEFVRSVHQNHPNAMVVIAGDYNLVGSKDPLETMADSLGVDGSDLSPVDAEVIGDRTMVTWNDEKSRFSPGRLDWMLIDESMSSAANAFIIDTRVLSERTLKAIRLEVDDSKSSDHLPIIVDLTKSN